MLPYAFLLFSQILKEIRKTRNGKIKMMTIDIKNKYSIDNKWTIYWIMLTQKTFLKRVKADLSLKKRLFFSYQLAWRKCSCWLREWKLDLFWNSVIYDLDYQAETLQSLEAPQMNVDLMNKIEPISYCPTLTDVFITFLLFSRFLQQFIRLKKLLQLLQWLIKTLERKKCPKLYFVLFFA